MGRGSFLCKCENRINCCIIRNKVMKIRLESMNAVANGAPERPIYGLTLKPFNPFMLRCNIGN